MKGMARSLHDFAPDWMATQIYETKRLGRLLDAIRRMSWEVDGRARGRLDPSGPPAYKHLTNGPVAQR